MPRIKYLFFAFLMVSCSDNEFIDSIDFGDTYNIVSEKGVPSLDSDGILTVKVAHSGCGPNHTFELKESVRPNTSELWLFKATANQQCQAYFEYEVEFELSENVLNSQFIILHSPDGRRISLK